MFSKISLNLFSLSISGLNSYCAVVLLVNFHPAHDAVDDEDDEDVDGEAPGKEEGMGGRPPPWPPPALSAAHERTGGTSACQKGSFYFMVFSIFWCLVLFGHLRRVKRLKLEVVCTAAISACERTEIIETNQLKTWLKTSGHTSRLNMGYI